MGVIYSPETVRNCLVPHQDAHPIVGQHILGVIEDIPGAYATIHGSVAEGRHNVTSDLDVVIALEGSAEDSLQDIKTFIANCESSSGVRIEHRIVTSSLPTFALYGAFADPCFNRYLLDKLDNADWSVGAPPMYLRAVLRRYASPSDVVRATVEYAEAKYLKQVSAPAFDPEHPSTLKLLQRRLELPAALHRKYVSFSKAGHAHDLLPSDMHDSAQDDIMALCHAKEEYHHELESCVAGQTSPRAYGSFLKVTYDRTLEPALSALSRFRSHILGYIPGY